MNTGDMEKYCPKPHPVYFNVFSMWQQLSGSVQYLINVDIWKFHRRTQTMARRSGWSRTFRKDSRLQQYFLDKVVPTGKTLGTGSYGSVLEVSGEF